MESPKKKNKTYTDKLTKIRKMCEECLDNISEMQKDELEKTITCKHCAHAARLENGKMICTKTNQEINGDGTCINFKKKRRKTT